VTKLTFGTADLSSIPSVLSADSEGYNIHGDFLKLKVDMLGQFSLNDSWSISSVSSCQWANKNLSSSEKIALSGINGVRGFSGGDLSADIGCFFQTELVTQVSSEVGVFAGIDFGAAKINAKSASIADSSKVKNENSLSSFSAGVRGNNGSSLSYTLSYGIPISICEICKQTSSSGQIYATLVLDL
jgi:hemolysin activation/secretion protein